jgi:hypothetical protein
MKDFKTFSEDLASGRPAKKPVSSSLLKNMAKDNEKAMASGFMKLSPKERAKESKRLGEDKDMCSCDCDCGKAICESCGKPKKLDEVSNELVKKVAHKRNQNVSMAGSKADYDRRDPNYQDAAKKQDRNQKLRFARGAKAIGKVRNESARDNYNPEISDKRTKEKLKKAGLPPESPKVMEAKKPIVHSTKPDSLKMVKIKYNKPIKTKVTDIGPGGKETVRKNWDEQVQIVTNLNFNEGLSNLVSRGLDKVRSSIKDAEKRTGLSVDASKNNKNNPVSGDNIRKRLASQKKR